MYYNINEPGKQNAKLKKKRDIKGHILDEQSTKG